MKHTHLKFRSITNSSYSRLTSTFYSTPRRHSFRLTCLDKKHTGVIMGKRRLLIKKYYL